MEFITKEGFERLKEELATLEKERPIVVKDLDEARKQGDLSENAGYHASKAKLAQIDKRIGVLRQRIPTCRIIQMSDSDAVQVGSYVKVLVSGKDIPTVMRIVGEGDLVESEQEPHVTNITFSSKVAVALLEKKVGDTVVVFTPAGEREYEILEISSCVIMP